MMRSFNQQTTQDYMLNCMAGHHPDSLTAYVIMHSFHTRVQCTADTLTLHKQNPAQSSGWTRVSGDDFLSFAGRRVGVGCHAKLIREGDGLPD
jgi:hypothetical protein